MVPQYPLSQRYWYICPKQNTTMKFKAHINIMPREELLDPQGKTVANNLHNIEIDGIEEVRIGKRIRMVLEAQSENDAHSKVEQACKKLLANVIMETFEFSIEPL